MRQTHFPTGHRRAENASNSNPQTIRGGPSSPQFNTLTPAKSEIRQRAINWCSGRLPWSVCRCRSWAVVSRSRIQISCRSSWWTSWFAVVRQMLIWNLHECRCVWCVGNSENIDVFYRSMLRSFDEKCYQLCAF